MGPDSQGTGMTLLLHGTYHRLTAPCHPISEMNLGLPNVHESAPPPSDKRSYSRLPPFYMSQFRSKIAPISIGASFSKQGFLLHLYSSQ